MIRVLAYGLFGLMLSSVAMGRGGFDCLDFPNSSQPLAVQGADGKWVATDPTRSITTGSQAHKRTVQILQDLWAAIDSLSASGIHLESGDPLSGFNETKLDKLLAEIKDRIVALENKSPAQNEFESLSLVSNPSDNSFEFSNSPAFSTDSAFEFLKSPAPSQESPLLLTPDPVLSRHSPHPLKTETLQTKHLFP